MENKEKLNKTLNNKRALLALGVTQGIIKTNSQKYKQWKHGVFFYYTRESIKPHCSKSNLQRQRHSVCAQNNLHKCSSNRNDSCYF